MKLIQKIEVTSKDEDTGEVSSIVLEGGKILKKTGDKVDVLDNEMTKIICEQLNATMGIMMGRM